MANAEIPTKPYLLRALYEWCVDNGYTAHLAVKVDSRSQVPSEYVRNGEITLNVAPSAVHKLQMGNDLIEFSARFAGVARQISVPVAGVYASIPSLVTTSPAPSAAMSSRRLTDARAASIGSNSSIW